MADSLSLSQQQLETLITQTDNVESLLTSIRDQTDGIEGLSIPVHDYIGLSYAGSNLTGVVYKTGGSGGTTVATLTLAYSGGNLTSVTKI